MPSNITVQEAASRLAGSAFTGAERYKQGTTGKGSKWQSRAGAAEASYKEGVSRALTEGKFSKGVQAAGSSAYQQGVDGKGAANFSSGLQFGADKYARKVAKYATLWGQELPTARGARRSAANLQRMQQNVERFQKVS